MPTNRRFSCLAASAREVRIGPIGRYRSKLGALVGPYTVHRGAECLLLVLPARHCLSIDAERQRRVRAPPFAPSPRAATPRAHSGASRTFAAEEWGVSLGSGGSFRLARCSLARFIAVVRNGRLPGCFRDVPRIDGPPMTLRMRQMATAALAAGAVGVLLAGCGG